MKNLILNNTLKKRKFYEIFGLEIASLSVFLIFILLILTIFMNTAPKELLTINKQIKEMNEQEFNDTKGYFKSYIITFYTLLILFITGSLSIFLLSRKFIWERIINNKFTLKSIKRYSIFLILLSLVIVIISLIVYFILSIFFQSIPFLIGKLSEGIQLFVTNLIPLVLIMYVAILVHYIYNYNFIKNKYKFKKVKLNLKKYVLPLAIMYVCMNILTYLFSNLLRDNMTFATIIGVLVFSIQISFIKMMVFNLEK
jgi:uncharacterized membrane protein